MADESRFTKTFPRNIQSGGEPPQSRVVPRLVNACSCLIDHPVYLPDPDTAATVHLV